MSHRFKFLFVVGLSFLPILAFAQGGGGKDIEDFIGQFYDILDSLMPVIMALALLFFLWGLLQYITKTGDEEGRKAARNTMVWGVIILFVMASVWGLVGILQDTTDIDSRQPVEAPKLPDQR